MNTYLENALNQENNEEKTKIRKAIKDNFKKRECFSLIRPVEDEKELQNLESLPESKFRNEFLVQCKQLRELIYDNISAKAINGRILTGENLISFLEDIVNSINSGGVPVIENSWK